MSKSDCLFCRIVRKEIPAKIVYEDAATLAFEDIRPQAPVHILVIPKSHVEKTADLTGSHVHMIGRLVLAAASIARSKNIEEPGYRIVLNCNRDAGQEVFHIHLHLLGGRKFAWPPG